MASGQISDNQDIPIPSGYSYNECMFFANGENGWMLYSINGQRVRFYRLKLTRQVASVWGGSTYQTVSYDMPTIDFGGSGKYFVIGVKS